MYSFPYPCQRAMRIVHPLATIRDMHGPPPGQWVWHLWLCELLVMQYCSLPDGSKLGGYKPRVACGHPVTLWERPNWEEISERGRHNKRCRESLAWDVESTMPEAGYCLDFSVWRASTSPLLLKLGSYHLEQEVLTVQLWCSWDPDLSSQSLPAQERRKREEKGGWEQETWSCAIIWE